nr:MAG TPA: hypothetical protein [Caudoviricetes sp.]
MVIRNVHPSFTLVKFAFTNFVLIIVLGYLYLDLVL